MNRTRRRALSRRTLLLGSLALPLGLGCERRPSRPATLGTLGGFSLTSQDGKPFGAEQLRGGVWVAAFLFTRCPTVCPRIVARMKALAAEARQKKLGLRFVAFSVDPEHDTPEVLAQYARKSGVDSEDFTLLTGDLEAIKKTSVEGFKMALEGTPDAGAEHLGMLHGSHLVLVDKALGIAGYYRTSDDGEMQRLLADAATL